MRKFFLLAILCNFSIGLSGYAQDLRLWYRTPASRWTEALPVGNGRLGAMIFSGTETEHIQFNEESLWTGRPRNYNRKDAYQYLGQIRELLAQGKQAEADALAEKHFMGLQSHESDDKYWIEDEKGNKIPQYQADYQPFGDLRLAFGHSNVTDYHRELDLREAIQRTHYTYNGVKHRRQIYASAVDQSIVVELQADQPGAISTNFWMDAPHKGAAFKKLDDSTFVLNVQVNGGALHGESRVRVRRTGGTHRFENGKIVVEKADQLILLLTAATNFKRYDDVSGNPATICQQQLQAIAKRSVDKIRKDHINDYQQIFNRFAIHFGSSPQEDKPTNQRIDEFARSSDPSLMALYAQYGRYLLIASSRPGTMPANLQGIWNDLLSPPWGSKYTTNINAEMNYWPAEPLNLSDHHEPLFRMIEEASVRGRETARAFYNARGWVLHHNTDLWRGTAPINAANHGIWQTGGAWLAHHLWEHFLFTRDTSFLRQKYPIMRDAAVFFLDAMILDPKTGWYITSPSNSPEQGGLVAGPAMDHQIVRSLFKAVIEAGNLLNQDKPLLDSMQTRLKAIAPDQIGRYGHLQEWMQDMDDPTNRHRHVSHLWAVYPGTEITWEKNPAYVKAAKQSLLFRGDAATGWSLGWKINLWARFKDGDHVYKLLQMLLSPADKEGAGSYPNLFDAHPPFQIDGNFGGAAGIVEMLVQSHDGFIDILPALPSTLREGHILGVKVRGGAELNIAWENGVLTYVDILSEKGGNYLFKYGQQKQMISLPKGGRVRLNKSLQQTR